MGEGKAPFRRCLRANPAAWEELFPSPIVLIVGEAALFGDTHFCVPKPCATEIWPCNRIWAVSQKGSNAPALKRKKKCRGQKATPFPPPFITGGAGGTQAAATGAYKDLSAGKGIRLQPRAEGAEAHSHRAPSLASGRFAPAAGSGPPAVPRVLGGWSLSPSGLEALPEARKLGI